MLEHDGLEDTATQHIRRHDCDKAMCSGGRWLFQRPGYEARFHAHRRVAIEKCCNLIGGRTSNTEHQDQRVLNHAPHHHFAFHHHGRAVGRAAISDSGLYVRPFILCHATILTA